MIPTPLRVDRPPFVAPGGAQEETVRDEVLMDGLARGEVEPLGPLFQRHAAVVLRVVRRYAPSLDRQEAEDVCQDVFLTALHAAPRYRGAGSVRSWLCGIAVRRARGRQRRQRLRQVLLGRFSGAATGLALAVEEPVHAPAQARLDAGKALAALPAPLREVLYLHAVENLSGDEVATVLGIDVNTVWTRLHRARHRMRAALAEPKGGKP